MIEGPTLVEEKTALVLSAGAMFGAYQAGAYKVLAELAPPDMVIGASVGALNGWLIASGCAPEHLIDRWLDPSAGAALRLFEKCGWSDLGRRGWFDPAPLRAHTEAIFQGFRPRIPFGVIVIELPGLRARLVRYPHVAAGHLQATCSIPLFLPSVKIDGRRYLDGGLFEKLPLWAAIEMGATRIIAIDSLPDTGNPWLHLGIKIAHVFRARTKYSPHLDLTIVSPSAPLGSIADAVFWKRANIERWVDLGMRDTARVLAGSRAGPVTSLQSPVAQSPPYGKSAETDPPS